MDPAGWISEEQRLPKLPSSKTFTLGYLPDTALSSESLDIVVLMFVYSWYRWALSRTNANLLKKIARILEYQKWGWVGPWLFNKNCEWNKSSLFCISFSWNLIMRITIILHTGKPKKRRTGPQLEFFDIL